MKVCFLSKVWETCTQVHFMTKGSGERLKTGRWKILLVGTLGYRTCMDYNQEIYKIGLKWCTLYCYCFEGIIVWSVDGGKYIVSRKSHRDLSGTRSHFAGEKLKLRCDLPQIMYTFVNESCSWDLNCLQIHIHPISVPSLKYLSSFWKSYLSKMALFWNLPSVSQLPLIQAQ